jgi:hypothetical protein
VGAEPSLGCGEGGTITDCWGPEGPVVEIGGLSGGGGSEDIAKITVLVWASQLQGVVVVRVQGRGCFIFPRVWYSHSRVKFRQSKQGSSRKTWRCLL